MKINHKGTNKITMTSNLRVEVELEAFKKMQCYIDLCDKEVGWLGTAYKKGNVITIKDVFLFDQEVHSTTCELTPQGLSDFTMELFETLPGDDAMEIVNNMALWGHSHVRMGVSPSGQDDKQLREFSNSGYEWFLRVIGNKHGDFEYTYIDYATGIEIKDLSWDVKIPGLDITSLKKEIKAEVDLKVKDMPVVNYRGLYNPGYSRGSYVNPGYSSNGYYGGHIDDAWPDSLLDPDLYAVNKVKTAPPTIEEMLGGSCEEEDPDNPYSAVEQGLSDYHDELITTIPLDELDDITYQILDSALSLGLTFEHMADLGLIYRKISRVDSALKVAEEYLMSTYDKTLNGIVKDELLELMEVCDNLRPYLETFQTIKVMNEGKETKFVFPSQYKDESGNTEEGKKRRGRPRKGEAEKEVKAKLKR